MDEYTKDLERQNEELKEKLAASQLSYKTYKYLITLVYENSKVEWEGDRSERKMIVRSTFRVTPKDVLVAKDYPDAKELFEGFKDKADANEENKAKF
jgi:hypothetical protein